MNTRNLEHDHTDHAIATRIASSTDHSYLGDTILGAVDGTVTTFAVVSAAAGASLSSGVAVVMGIANLIADGFSMAAGNYFRAKADQDVVEKARRIEEKHIDMVPDGEREEVRQIFAAKGFRGEVLDEVVDVITKDRKRWVDTMLTEELGLQLDNPEPVKAGVSTFFAFCVAGFVPLIPFLIMIEIDAKQTFVASCVATGFTFFGIGVWRGKALQHPLWRSGIETLLVGGAAAVLAYFIGMYTKNILGAAGGLG